MNELFRQYKLMFDAMEEGAFFQKADGTLIDVNPAALKMFGLTPDQFMGRTSSHPEWQVVNEYGKTLPPEQHPSMIALSTGQQVRNFIAGVFNPLRQTTVWLEINATPLFLESEPVPDQVFVTIHDITERKRTEESLRESEERYRAIVENSFDVIFILDTNGIFRYVCPSWQEHFGYSATEVIGKPFAPVVHPDDVQPCFEYLTRVIATGQPGASPRYRVQCLDGSWKTFVANGSRFINAQGEILFHGIGRDISPLEQTLLKLQSSEKKFATTFNNSPALMAISSINDGRYLEVNDRFCQVSNLKREEVIGKTSVELGWIPEEKRQEVREILLRDGRVSDLEIELARNDGETVYCLISAEVITIERQQLLLSIAIDVTDRMKAEKALKLSEELYRAVVNTQTEFVERFLPGGIITFVNEALCRYSGFPAANLIGTSFFRFVHEDDREPLTQKLASLTPQQPTIDTFDRIVFSDGSIGWHHWTNTAIFDNNGAIIEYQAVGRDITRQKLTEEALRESEERYRRFIATANEGIGITDRDYTITYANSRLGEILGYEPTEMIGMQVRQLLAVEERNEFSTVMAQHSQGISCKREFKHFHKDGSFVWLLTSSTPILDKSDTFEGCFAMFTDLTRRKEAEMALQKSFGEMESQVTRRTAALTNANKQIKMMSFELIRAQEQERIRIAAELHDQVGQALLLAKIRLDMLASELSPYGKEHGAADISILIETCIQDIRTLTFGMRPPLLDTAGLEAALTWLCKSIKQYYHLQVTFTGSSKPVSLSREQRYSLYQAIRELLLNVAKHAGVDSADLTLSSDGSTLAVQVSDKGNGFDAALSQQSLANGGLGIFNVQHRIEQMGGSFTLVSAPLQGTTVILTIPTGD